MEPLFSDFIGAKIQVKRPWTDREKDAVQRRMAKFIALKKVPGKKDCLLCIGKESPVFCTQTRILNIVSIMK